MKTFLPGVVAAATLLCCFAVPAVAQNYDPNVVSYDNTRSYINSDPYPYSGVTPIAVTGEVMRVADNPDRITVRTDRGRRYLVDTYNAEVVTPSGNAPDPDISPGVRVRVVGRLLGGHFIEAGRVSVLSVDSSVKVYETPRIPQPVVVVMTDRPDPVTVDAVVTSILPDEDQLFVIDGVDHTYRVKAHDADIIVPHTDRAGTMADLSRGTHVRVIGRKDKNTIILADRIRILVDEAPAPPPPAPIAPPVLDLSVFTGIVIDVRGFERIQRSPNPSLYDSDMNLLYPDRSHVPSPDEVQDESTVRYYRSLDEASSGVGGSHPLVLHAESVVGPAEDGVMLTAEDSALFKALDKRLHYTNNWKVAFLIPGDR